MGRAKEDGEMASSVCRALVYRCDYLYTNESSDKIF